MYLQIETDYLNNYYKKSDSELFSEYRKFNELYD